MYFLLGISLSLAFLLVVNLLVAVMASAIWRAAATHIRGLSARVQGQIVFGLRVLPVTAALIFVAAFVVPAYVMYEPAASGEVVSSKLALIAAASSIGVAFAFFRVLRTWMVTRRLTADWLSNAIRIELDDGSVSVYRIVHPFPVVAVVGILRPRLFVADKVLTSLTAREIQSTIAHEYGHLSSNDNLKRTLLRICRDLLIFPLGTRLDRAWADNTESVADEYAARSGRSTALDLASALVKIARLVPAGSSPATPAGAFLLDEQNVDVTARVQRLVRLSEDQGFSSRSSLFGLSPASGLWSTALLALLLMPLFYQNLYVTTHQAIERFVHILQ